MKVRAACKPGILPRVKNPKQLRWTRRLSVFYHARNSFAYSVKNASIVLAGFPNTFSTTPSTAAALPLT